MRKWKFPKPSAGWMSEPVITKVINLIITSLSHQKWLKNKRKESKFTIEYREAKRKKWMKDKNNKLNERRKRERRENRERRECGES